MSTGREPFVPFLLAAVMAGCTPTNTAGPDGGAAIAYQPGSPWPKFRGDAAQDGRSALKPAHGATGAMPWSFPTGKGIFSSPVVAADGTILVGSADRYFYALAPDGTLKWKVLTGEIIDSAGLLDDQGRVYFGSGDGKLRALDIATGTAAWTTAADPPGTNGSFIDWFEGNVALGPSGRLYAGNDDFFVYGIDRDGKIAERLRVPDQTWSLPAIDPATGTLFFGNNNVVSFLGDNLYAYAADGTLRWSSFVEGTMAASAMLTPDGAMVIGGFDGYLHALDQASGKERWRFGARDHLYASPARLSDGTVVQAGTDGTVYALDPATGMVRWTFDRLEPVRSSPAVDGDDNIYFGGGNGRLYSLAPDGKLRWSMLLIASDRNDLNSSPALGPNGIYIGGESGEVFSVPWDYCLRADGMADPRCATAADPPLVDTGAVLYSSTEFGAISAMPPAAIDPNQSLAFTLYVREGGATRLAVLDPAALSVTVDPPVEVEVEVAGDGKFFTVAPKTAFTTAADGKVGFTISAPYLVDLQRSGLKLSGGTPGGAATLSFRANLNPPPATPYPLPFPTNAGDPAGVWEVARLALPLPTILPSYNQIGFDSLHYLVGLVESGGAGPGTGIAWMVGAMLAANEDRTVIDPNTKALFPFVLTAKDDFLTLSNTDGLRVEVMNAAITFKSFRMSVALGSDGSALGAARLTGSTVCASLPVYGSFLETLGLCNPTTDVLSVYGGALFRPWQGGTTTPPAGVGQVAFASDGQSVTATLTGSTLKVAEHVLAVLLVDAATGLPVTLDYGLSTTRTAAADGTAQTVTIPFGTQMIPRSLRAYLMVDAYPAASGTLMLK
jgi:outer membrane protein assembly factor BamB